MGPWSTPSGANSILQGRRLRMMGLERAGGKGSGEQELVFPIPSPWLRPWGRAQPVLYTLRG